jgi:hypothetical protein
MKLSSDQIFEKFKPERQQGYIHTPKPTDYRNEGWGPEKTFQPIPNGAYKPRKRTYNNAFNDAILFIPTTSGKDDIHMQLYPPTVSYKRQNKNATGHAEHSRPAVALPGLPFHNADSTLSVLHRVETLNQFYSTKLNKWVDGYKNRITNTTNSWVSAADDVYTIRLVNDYLQNNSLPANIPVPGSAPQQAAPAAAAAAAAAAPVPGVPGVPGAPAVNASESEDVTDSESDGIEDLFAESATGAQKTNHPELVIDTPDRKIRRQRAAEESAYKIDRFINQVHDTFILRPETATRSLEEFHEEARRKIKEASDRYPGNEGLFKAMFDNLAAAEKNVKAEIEKRQEWRHQAAVLDALEKEEESANEMIGTRFDLLAKQAVDSTLKDAANEGLLTRRDASSNAALALPVIQDLKTRIDRQRSSALVHEQVGQSVQLTSMPIQPQILDWTPEGARSKSRRPTSARRPRQVSPVSSRAVSPVSPRAVSPPVQKVKSGKKKKMLDQHLKRQKQALLGDQGLHWI